MLVLSRKLKQEILIGENVKITVLKIKGNTVRLGIEAPREVHVVRGELEPKTETTIVDVPLAVSSTEDDQYGQFTVVFSNTEEDSAKVDVVPFANSQTRAIPPNKDMATRQSTANGSVEEEKVDSIAFRNRIPQSLQHNRLKEIVNSLTTNKK